MRANKLVREKIKNSGIKHWEIARYLGVGENTIVRWLRTPLSLDKEERILNAIDKLKREAT